jgi:hypothetical protein
MSEVDDSGWESEIICPSLAIRLVDDYTAGSPRGWVDVSIKGLNKKAVKNLGFCFTFFNLASKQITGYTVQVKSENYFDLEFYLEPKIGELPPVYNLTPRPSYPFPQGETLVRGTITNSKNIPIRNADINSAVENLTFSGRTDNKGDFAVYFKSLKPENFSNDGSYIVASEDNNNLVFNLNYPDQDELSKGLISGIFENIKAGMVNSKGKMVL